MPLHLLARTVRPQSRPALVAVRVPDGRGDRGDRCVDHGGPGRGHRRPRSQQRRRRSGERRQRQLHCRRPTRRRRRVDPGGGGVSGRRHRCGGSGELGRGAPGRHPAAERADHRRDRQNQPRHRAGHGDRVGRGLREQHTGRDGQFRRRDRHWAVPANLPAVLRGEPRRPGRRVGRVLQTATTAGKGKRGPVFHRRGAVHGRGGYRGHRRRLHQTGRLGHRPGRPTGERKHPPQSGVSTPTASARPATTRRSRPGTSSPTPCSTTRHR